MRRFLTSDATPPCESDSVHKPHSDYMTELILHSTPQIAAAGPAFLVWLFGGGFGLAFLVFVVLKVMGK
jgi:hypothetical protein